MAIMIVVTLMLAMWIVLRIRRIDLSPAPDFLTALRATPLIVVILLDLLVLASKFSSRHSPGLR